MKQEEEICSKCGTILRDSKNSYTVESEKKEKPRKRFRRYKFWVTPLNILFLCLFIAGIDMAIVPIDSPFQMHWAFWPIIGIITIFLLALILSKRPESFWVIAPLIFANISMLLYFIDRSYGENDGIFGLDWALIPTLALLIFGFAIPVVSRLGYIKETPEDKFKKMVGEE